MTIYFEDEAGISFPFDQEAQLERLVAFVTEYVGCPYEPEVSVTMVDRKTIRRMNGEYRKTDQETDVLSFPMMEYDAPMDFEGAAFQSSISLSRETQELILGDIVLCSEVVRDQAAEYGHTELREFSFLVVHSLLHLFGFDHMEESERVDMEEAQREIMDQLQIYR